MHLNPPHHHQHQQVPNFPHYHHQHHHHHHNQKRRLHYNSPDHHCQLCCDNCNEIRTTRPTPCGGFQMQTINPYKGYTIYQTQCICSPTIGAANEMFYMKFITPYNQPNCIHECQCQCHQSNMRKRGWIGNMYQKNRNLFGNY